MNNDSSAGSRREPSSNRGRKIPFFLKFNSSEETCAKIEAMLKRRDVVLGRIEASNREILEKLPKGAIVIERSELECFQRTNTVDMEDNAKLRAEILFLEEQLRAKERDCNDYKEREARARKHLDTEKEPNGESQKTKVDLQEKNKDLQEQNEGLHEKNKDLHEKNKGLHEKNKDLHEKNKDLHEKNKDLQEEIVALKTESRENSKGLTSVVEPYLVLAKNLEECPSTCELVAPYTPLTKVENRILFVGFVGSERSLAQSVFNAMKRYKTAQPKPITSEEKELIDQINSFYKQRDGIDYDLLEVPEATGKFDKNKYQDLGKPANVTFRTYEEVYVPMVMKDEKVVQFRGIVKGK